MSLPEIQFTGTLHYASRESLARAIAEARSRLDDDDVTDPALASLRSFVGHGNRLQVDVVLPGAADVRFAAAAVFETLAERAIDGAVEARQGAAAIELFSSGADD